ncbi:hypothetical protein NEOLI_000730 [Neolecta irregularis DAH-3]|uniref:Uncharacterized protein n=1 Tax=Neolecta irregularis (strain DAH-3) TaxID=1198029 RepID=A0A1U7LWD5_NEOID|nr:hypothetical protein NEOLI_000730 [Neolecta irregularis DAH-3]|eukprot:OLL26939.1 hypothetical protein NEOLI_000730 [Neolecta irregularis DAH-3]
MKMPSLYSTNAIFLAILFGQIALCNAAELEKRATPTASLNTSVSTNIDPALLASNFPSTPTNSNGTPVNNVQSVRFTSVGDNVNIVYNLTVLIGGDGTITTLSKQPLSTSTCPCAPVVVPTLTQYVYSTVTGPHPSATTLGQISNFVPVTYGPANCSSTMPLPSPPAGLLVSAGGLLADTMNAPGRPFINFLNQTNPIRTVTSVTTASISTSTAKTGATTRLHSPTNLFATMMIVMTMFTLFV